MSLTTRNQKPKPIGNNVAIVPDAETFYDLLFTMWTAQCAQCAVHISPSKKSNHQQMSPLILGYKNFPHNQRQNQQEVWLTCWERIVYLFNFMINRFLKNINSAKCYIFNINSEYLFYDFGKFGTKRSIMHRQDTCYKISSQLRWRFVQFLGLFLWLQWNKNDGGSSLISRESSTIMKDFKCIASRLELSARQNVLYFRGRNTRDPSIASNLCLASSFSIMKSSTEWTSQPVHKC